MISPDQRSGIGQIRLPDSESPLPVHTRHVEVVNDEQSFTATLIVDHGDDLIRAEIKIASQPDGAMTLSEKLTALADVTTDEIATGLIGILNNPHWVYETGKRRITFNDKESIIDALSGVTLSAPQASTISIDDVLEITSDKPLGTHYRAGEKMERGRATDLLFLNHLGQQRRWNSGEVISEFQVQIRRIGE